MADVKIKIDSSEEEYRKQSEWHSFASKAWGGLAGASFFGALMALAQALVSKAAAGYIDGGNEMLKASISILNPLPLAVLGGMAAFGLAATYMSQREETAARILSEDHMAKEQAKCMGLTKAPTIELEHEHNCRKDGKKWGDIVIQRNDELAQAATR